MSDIDKYSAPPTRLELHTRARARALAKHVRALKKELRVQLRRVALLKSNQRLVPTYDELKWQQRVAKRVAEQAKELGPFDSGHPTLSSTDLNPGLTS